jgi:hypothetical protein
MWMFLGTVGICGALWGGRAWAQASFAGTAGNFSMNEYYAPPHELQMKTLISGAEAQPQPEGRYLIKDLHVETFSEDGQRQAVVEAPECVYDAADRMAWSSGHIKAQSGEGRFTIEGDGFLWRQDAADLTISNRVSTLIANSAKPFRSR